MWRGTLRVMASNFQDRTLCMIADKLGDNTLNLEHDDFTFHSCVTGIISGFLFLHVGCGNGTHLQVFWVLFVFTFRFVVHRKLEFRRPTLICAS